MLIKWIKCFVPNGQKKMFSKAQEQWIALKGLDGFLGQAGGWNIRNLQEACIIALWKDLDAYESFMNDHHDVIFEKSNQRHTYEKISVVLYEKMLDILGTSPDLLRLFRIGKLLKITECIVHKGQQEFFEKMQQEIWKMAESEGMLAGVVSKSLTNNNHYFVASIWKNKELHQKYVQTKLPFLHEQSQLTEITREIAETIVELEELWTVMNEK
jgi:heme-degrading monooxygenase HmoA